MIVKIAVPQRFQFKMAAGFGDVMFPRPRDTHYIGGTEVLPSPLEPEQEQEMIDRLEGYHPNFKYTLYENVGHDSWTRAFSEELLQWMLAQHK